jgi:hypothetical protein
MFSPIFLPLTLSDGSVTYVNTDHIVSIYRTPGASTTVVCCTDDQAGEFRDVLELPSTILEMIQEATDFPNN